MAINHDDNPAEPNPARANAPNEGAPDAASPTVKKKRDWKAWLVFAGGAGAILWGLLAAFGSGWGLWGWQSGFTGLLYSVILAVVTLLVAALIWWLHKRKSVHGNRPLHWIGVVLALVYVGYLGTLAMHARSVPAIHDISTDLADPPAFRSLSLREDNWDNIPGEDDEDMRGLNPQQRWRRIHQDEYGDIRTVRVDRPVKEVMAKAERLAEDRGWDIAALRVAEGRMEAVATTQMFGFKDDVVLRVKPTQDDKGSIVDMRSVSRVGQSDLGANAERVQDFLADLSGTVTAG